MYIKDVTIIILLATFPTKLAYDKQNIDVIAAENSTVVTPKPGREFANTFRK